MRKYSTTPIPDRSARAALIAAGALFVAPGCGDLFSETEEVAAFGDRGHLHHTYDDRLPNALNAAIEQCNTWPLEIMPDTVELDLMGHCTPTEMAQIMITQLPPEEDTAYNEWQLSTGIEAAGLRINVSEAFPSALRRGLQDSMHEVIVGSGFPDEILSCSVEGSVSVSTDLDIAGWNVCLFCKDFVDGGACDIFEDPDCAFGSLTCGLIETNFDSFENWWDQHCFEPDTSDVATLIIEGISTKWGRYNSAPALELELEFANDMKIAEMRIGAGVDCSGAFAPLIESFNGGRLNLEAIAREFVATVLPLGRYDVHISGLTMQASFPAFVNRGELTTETRTKVSIAALDTDEPLGPWSLEQFLALGGMSIAGLEDDVADAFEDNLQPHGAQLAELLTSTVPPDHKICSVRAQTDKWTGEVETVRVHSGPIMDSCTQPDNSIAATDLPWCMVWEGKLLCLAGVPGDPMGGIDPEEFLLDEIAAEYTWAIVDPVPEEG